MCVNSLSNPALANHPQHALQHDRDAPPLPLLAEPPHLAAKVDGETLFQAQQREHRNADRSAGFWKAVSVRCAELRAAMGNSDADVSAVPRIVALVTQETPAFVLVVAAKYEESYSEPLGATFSRAFHGVFLECLLELTDPALMAEAEAEAVAEAEAEAEAEAAARELHGGQGCSVRGSRSSVASGSRASSRRNRAGKGGRPADSVAASFASPDLAGAAARAKKDMNSSMRASQLAKGSEGIASASMSPARPAPLVNVQPPGRPLRKK